MRKILIAIGRGKVIGLLVMCPFLFILFYANPVSAQEKENTYGEKASCRIILSDDAQAKMNGMLKTTGKDLIAEPNQLGYFNRITGIRPNQKLKVEVSYPQGNAGEKVSLIVMDGGKLAGERSTDVMQLDANKKIVFHFQVTDDPGIYRISLKKGDDEKIVQLWVGEELPFAKQ